jgi:Na+/H+ antiporter NhaD/arsenite permease-like protein
MNFLDYLALLVIIAGVAVAFYRLKLGPVFSWLTPLLAGAIHVLLRHTCMNATQATVSGIFVVIYALIATDKMDRTKTALLGAGVMLLVKLVSQEEAFHGAEGIPGVDWNTVFLLIGMMVIVNITRETGIFQWVAIRTAKLAKGDPIMILMLIPVATAILSAALDNVTTVLLIAPVTILICRGLQTNPVPYLICVTLASNIGGTSTLIGDPPNIMIGSAGRLGFVDFLRVNTIPVVVIGATFLLTIRLALGRRLQVTPEQRASVMSFDETKAITNHALLRRCLVVIGLTLTGFCLHGALHLEPATIALAGAALMLLLHSEGPEEALKEVEWPTIFFYIGLFIMVGGLVKVGVVAMLGDLILDLTQGNLLAMTMLMLWFSAITAGIVSNVPFVPVMTALIHGVAQTLHPEATDFFAAAHAPDVYPLWWALSLGACLGGNFTIVGASANVVTAGISARAGHPVSFLQFMKYGVPITLQSLVLASLWLWFIFLR